MESAVQAQRCHPNHKYAGDMLWDTPSNQASEEQGREEVRKV